jgi:hypothetical protein
MSVIISDEINERGRSKKSVWNLEQKVKTRLSLFKQYLSLPLI